MAVLEGDSAEVWARIFEQGGRLDHALDYVRRNGQFDTEPQGEARDVLAEFLVSLESQGLLVGRTTPQPSSGAPAKDDPDAGRTAERTINLWMADHHVLDSLVLELTYRCNERCVHCYCPSQRDRTELSTGALCDVVEELESLGGCSLQMTGGELFMRSDTKALLRFLRGREMVLSIISNLTLLDDETRELLEELAPRSVGCSIYSVDAALHDAVTTIPGSFNRSVRSIRRLRAAGIPVVLKTPLMKDTVSGWADIEAFAEGLGCSCQFDLNITARNDGGSQPLDLRVRDEDTITRLFATRFKRLHLHGEPLAIQGDGP